MSNTEKNSFKQFCISIDEYLENRITNKLLLKDSEIQQLKVIVEQIKLNNCISSSLKNKIYNKIIDLVYLSKSKEDNPKFKKNGISGLDLEELYLYLRIVIKHASFCLTKEYLGLIVARFRNDYEYLKRIKKVLDNISEKQIADKIIKKVSLLLLLEKEKEEFKNTNINYFNNYDEKLPLITDRNILTIDKTISPDLDGAFSVEKRGDLYYFNVYITDVPSFLLINKEILEIAFKRGTSMYNSQNSEKLVIFDMIPPILSHDYLSLKENNIRNVITFSYIIDSSGNIYPNGVSREQVLINCNVDPDIANSMILSNDTGSKVQEDLKMYRNVCELICKESNKKLLSRLNPTTISDLVAVPSILTNYYVGDNSSMAIYREHSAYTKSSIEHYTHSVTPLRKFVSNINLLMYLGQLGIINCPDKYIYHIEDNIDEIIKHLNEQEKLSEIFARNYRLIKKYYK